MKALKYSTLLLACALLFNLSAMAQTRKGSINQYSSISQAKRYFKDNILLLDPIEGIYEMENVVKAYAGQHSHEVKQEFIITVMPMEQENMFVGIDENHTPRMMLRKIGGSGYYELLRSDARGNEYSYKFKLDDMFSFVMEYSNRQGPAVSFSKMTMIKSYPTRMEYREAIDNKIAEERRRVEEEKWRAEEERRAAEEQQNSEWSGTGFALNNGYIVTNHHVVDGAKSIKVKGVGGKFEKDYHAEVVAMDKANDLALIKITESGFTGFGNIPYQVKNSMAEVGEEIFVLGYPLVATMGDEIKLTTGVISSRTGFQGDAALYQISAPVQPGNSGGPLFDSKGNLIGIVSAKHTGAENVGYAIKTSYLKNLIESSVSLPILPKTNTVSNLSLSEKVKRLKNFTFTIMCSDTEEIYGGSYNSGYNSSRTTEKNNGITERRNKIYGKFLYPVVKNKTEKMSMIKSVTINKGYTAVEIKIVNANNAWCNIDKNTYIVANGRQYTMTRAENIKIAPEKTYFSSAYDVLVFTLYFPAIPSNVTSIDLIESQDSPWKWYGIRLK